MWLLCVSDVPLDVPPPLCLLQIQGSIRPHAIIILPDSAGTEVLVCYEDEGVYIDTYGRITKDTVLQWGEMPASVGTLSHPLHPLSRPPDCSVFSPCAVLEHCDKVKVRFAGVLFSKMIQFHHKL